MKNNVYQSMRTAKDECYTSYSESKKLISYLIKNEIINKKMKIWLPFDNELSNIYIALNEEGYKTILSNLENGLNFYNYEPYEYWDLIITNPPFSNRTQLLDRLFIFKKPFIILQGSQFFNNQFAIKHLVEKNGNISFLLPRKRMNFLTYNQKLNKITSSKSAASFYSFWIAYHLPIYSTFIYLEDNGMEKDFEQLDQTGNAIIDNHFNLFNQKS